MRYRSSDGLLTTDDLDALVLWEQACIDHAKSATRWTELLRSQGVKLAHPYDGWVNEPGRNDYQGTESYLNLSWYPQFNDIPEVGDLIALGRADGLPYRLVRVTRLERGSRFISWTHFYYEDTGRRIPEPEPKKPSLLARLGLRFRSGTP